MHSILAILVCRMSALPLTWINIELLVFNGIQWKKQEAISQVCHVELLAASGQPECAEKNANARERLLPDGRVAHWTEEWKMHAAVQVCFHVI